MNNELTFERYQALNRTFRKGQTWQRSRRGSRCRSGGRGGPA